MKKRRISRILMLLAVMVMMLAIPAQAGTVKAGKTYAKPKKVTTGTTTVKQSAGTYGYVKFTAPKTKTYKFTFSKLRCNGSSQIVHSTGYITSGGEYKKLSFKQNGKTTTSLPLTTTYCYSFDTSNVSYLTYLPKRTASVKLQKGQTVVVILHASSTAKTVWYNLKIK